MLISADWPKPIAKFAFKKESEMMNVMIETIGAIRNLRQENRIDIGKKISAILVSKKWAKLLNEKKDTIMQIARLEKLELPTKAPTAGKCLKTLTKSGIEVMLPMAELIDLNAEIKRLNDERENLEQYISGMEGKLKNKNFTDRAPAEIVAGEKAKLATAKEKLTHISTQIKALE
jgi:valyl-tRNA synthetase